jgi:hypothetical protein
VASADGDKATIAQLTEEVETLTKARATLVASADGGSATIAQLTKEVETLTKARATLVASADGDTATIAQLTKEVETLTTARATLVASANTDKAAAVAALSEEVDALTRKLAAAEALFAEEKEPLHADLADASATVKRLLKVRTMGGDVHFSRDHNLDHLNGMRNTERINHDLILDGNHNLTAVDTFWNLKKVDGRVILKNNPNLAHINFPELTDADGIRIQACPLLTSLKGFDQVKAIGHNLELFGNDKLTSLEGLNKVKTIRGLIHIEVADSSQDFDVSALSLLQCHGGISRRTNVPIPDLLRGKPRC